MLIDQNHRQEQLNDPYAKMIEGMSRDEMIQLRDKLLAQKRGSMVQGAVGPLANTLAQRGGIKPYQAPEKENTLNDMLMKAAYTRMIEGSPEEKLRRELQIKAEMEAQDPLKQAQLRALEMVTGGGDVPSQFKSKGMNIAGQTFERIPTEAEQQQEINQKVREAQAIEEIKPPSQAQETNALYAKRLEQAEKVFDSLSGELSNLGLGSIVMQGKLGPLGVPNWAKTGAAQSYEQAKRNFINAVLRRESGAVISPSEFEEGNKQYFPIAGDKPEVIAQKKANRGVVSRSFVQSARKAYTPDKTYIKTGTDEATGKRVGMLADGTIEEII